MLILTRHFGGSVYIGDDIKVTVLSMVGAQIRLGIAAPKEVAVHRDEIHQRIQQEKAQRGSRPILHLQRGAVEPQYEFAADHDQIGTVLFQKPQQSWFGEAPNVLQIAMFAGQKIMAARSEDKHISFELHYLGFVTKGFASMEDAIASAPRFARETLARLSQLIQFDNEASASYG